MKVDEFVSSIAQAKLAQPKKRAASAIAAVVNEKDTDAADVGTPENIYGVMAEPGHELHRIRQHRPDVWHKIKNWD